MKGTPVKPREGSHTPPESTPPPPNTQTADPRAHKEQEWYAHARKQTQTRYGKGGLRFEV